jgi:hypothetical protein
MKNICFLLINFIFAALLLTAGQAGAFTPELYEAINDLETKGKISERQKALLFAHNDTINAMRVKQRISQRAYQAAQEAYAEKSLELARQAAVENGATLRIQRRMAGSPHDAGTDSDYITDAKDADQVERIQETYNQKVQDYLGEKRIARPGDKDWTKRHDVDFMADPTGLSQAEFERIAKVNNDAYKRREAASFEAKYRAGQEPPTVEEALKYNDEMRGFIDKKTGQIAEKSQELQKLRENRDTRSPDSGGKDPEAFIERQKLEAEIQVKMAQKAKYFERMQNANAVLARHGGVEAPDASNLPGQAKVRALPTDQGSPLHREISSSLADSVTDHLKAQGATNEARMLGVLAGRDPANAKQYTERIAEVTRNLTPSQKGEVVQLLRENPHVNDDLVREVVQKMKVDDAGMKTEQVIGKTPALHRAGAVTGMIGDMMSIDEAWKKAQQGDHLFFNIDEQDSENIKNLKMVAVAAIELAPIPIIDSLERGWSVDEKIKRQMLEDIQKGKTTSPYQATARLFAEIGVDAVATMTIKPVFAGVDAVREGAKTSADIWQNWQDKAIHEAAYKEQAVKYQEILARIDKIKLGAITGSRQDSSGRIRYDFTAVDPGETLSFEISRNPEWTERYETRWEVLDGGKRVMHRSIPLPAVTEAANSFRYVADLPAGKYTVIFRIFDRTSAKQMDASEKPFVIGGSLAFGPLHVNRNEAVKEPFSGAVTLGDLLAFQVERWGPWNEKYTIEWLVNGQIHKKTPAATPDSDKFRKRFSDGYDPGSYTVAVRAVDAETGKITAHRQFQFVIRAAVLETELKVQTSKVIPGDQAGHYSLAPPESFVPPFTVRVGGDGLEVNKSPDPLRGTFRGTVSASDSTHTLSFLVKDAKGRSARGTAAVTVRGITPKPIDSIYLPKQPTVAAPPPSRPAASRDKADTGGDDFSAQRAKIMEKYQNDMKRIRDEQNAKSKAINEQYKSPGQKPATPAWMSGGTPGGQSRQKQCRSFNIDASSCRNSFYSCMKRCPTAGAPGATHSSIQACHTSCGNANRACTKVKCTGGTLNGVGWNLTCTICQ